MKRFLKLRDRYLAIDSITSAYIDSTDDWTLDDADEEYAQYDYCVVVATSEGHSHIVSAGSEDTCDTRLTALMRVIGEVVTI